MGSKLVLANISLVLLASSCLVICTDYQPESEPSAAATTTGGELAPWALASRGTSEPYEAPSADLRGQLARDEELLLISSELCARNAQKCRSGEFDVDDCVSFGLLCALSATLGEAGALGHVGASFAPARWQQRQGAAPTVGLEPARSLHEMFNVAANRSAPRAATTIATSTAASPLDELGAWGEPRASARQLESEPRTERPPETLAERSLRQGDFLERHGFHQTSSAMLPPAPPPRAAKRLESARNRRLQLQLQLQPQQRRQSRSQAQWQSQAQRNLMDQRIVSALPSAFVFEEVAPSSGRGASYPLPSDPDAGGGEVGAAGAATASARSWAGARGRQLRSGGQQQQQQQRHRQRLQQQLIVPKRTDGGKSAISSTTSGHQIIQETGPAPTPSGLASDDQTSIMQCNMRQFTFTATKTDELGNRCSGLVAANICYGGCDTGEIADWLFPGKKSIHKVCRHGARVRRRAQLANCTSGASEPSEELRAYHYVDALDCVCKRCTSSDTTCLGTMAQPYLQTLQGALGAGGD